MLDGGVVRLSNELRQCMQRGVVRSVRIPGTSLVCSRLGFGTASLHHLSSSSQQLRLLSAAVEHGLTHFDTAPMYGEGMAERALGRFLSGGKRGKVTTATKIGFPAYGIAASFPPWMYLTKATRAVVNRFWKFGRPQRIRALDQQDVESSFTRSLRNLCAESVDILFVHEPSPSEIEPIARLAAWLHRQKECGRARHLGLAGNATGCLAVYSQLPGLFDILQVEDSIAGREADAVLASGMPLQITYGYLRAGAQGALVGRPPLPSRDILSKAMSRNPSGLVLVSTRKIERVVELASCMNGRDVT